MSFFLFRCCLFILSWFVYFFIKRDVHWHIKVKKINISHDAQSHSFSLKKRKKQRTVQVSIKQINSWSEALRVNSISLGCEKIRLSYWDGGHIYLSAGWHVTQVVKYVFPTTYLIFELFSFLRYRSFFFFKFILSFWRTTFYFWSHR